MPLQIPFQVADKTLYITSGDKSYEISEYRAIKNPKSQEIEDTLCPFKWFGALDGAITAALNMQIRASDASNFRELKEVIKSCTEKLASDYEIKPQTAGSQQSTTRRRRT